MPFGRRRFDPQPTAQAAVLLASSGSPISRAAIRRAHELAAGEPVAVLSILKVYGSSFGLPNPGLMPTRREREEQVAIVQRAIKDLERLGGTVDGQIAATRSAGRMIAKVARVRHVDWVVMDSPNATGMRKIIEGELTGIVRRRLAEGTTLEVVGAKL
jgi:nucleotide-binding universal stress UspA family protein